MAPLPLLVTIVSWRSIRIIQHHNAARYRFLVLSCTNSFSAFLSKLAFLEFLSKCMIFFSHISDEQISLFCISDQMYDFSLSHFSAFFSLFNIEQNGVHRPFVSSNLSPWTPKSVQFYITWLFKTFSTKQPFCTWWISMTAYFVYFVLFWKFLWLEVRGGEGGMSQPNLTEPLDIDQNEEYGQKRKCPPGPLFWGTVCPNLT